MVRLQEFRRGRRLVVELRNLPIALRVVIVCVDDYLAGQWLNGNAADVLEWNSHHDDFAILRRFDRRRGAGPGTKFLYERRELLSTGTIGPLTPNGFSQVALDGSVFPGVAGTTNTNLWVDFTSNQPVLA